MFLHFDVMAFEIVCDVQNSFAVDFLNLTVSFNLSQHVTVPTHTHGHTLDVVFTLGLSVNNLSLEGRYISDHNCVVFDIIIQSAVPKSKCTVHSQAFPKNSCVQFVHSLY